MADKTRKQEEDNRDIFDKVLDALPVAGAVAGGVIGRQLGRRAAAKTWKKAFGKDFRLTPGSPWRKDVIGAGQSGAILGTPAGYALGSAGYDIGRKPRKKK